ncbi:HpsJ-like protein, cyanoexosortase A-associated [Halotia branconii]|uniref:HpsJ family protein n=1 Tax=Halotia branconii CENA392 TaxID=1539056 RepID=A0AAJ6PCP5_9CYAN|nr:HpsJ family protein [Halotia branconii]WGV28996.1 HpsJ family protein [Halotia branconii CENA392]
MTTQKPEKLSHKSIEITEAVEKRSFALLRFLGYTLLIFSLIDYLGILIPPRLTDPVWEFQAIGQMVDHVWSPLLGLTFIFLYNQTSIVKPRRVSNLKFLSWFALAIGILYLLLLPLGINNSLTLYKNLNAQFTNQQAQQQEQLQKITDKLNGVVSLQELNNLANNLNIQNEAGSNQSPQGLKSKISQQIQTVAQNTLATAKVVKRQQIKNLIKDAVRINLGAIISGICFITLWNLTRWTRVNH